MTERATGAAGRCGGTWLLTYAPAAVHVFGSWLFISPLTSLTKVVIPIWLLKYSRLGM